MKRKFNFAVDNENAIKFNTEFTSLSYPISELKREELESYPNVIWILVDAWRYDMLSG